MRRAPLLGLAGLLVAAAVLVAVPARAQTTLVVLCDSGGSIQDAVTGSSPGDVIEVWGSCVEHVIVSGRSVTIRGAGPANTEVVGNGGGSVFTLNGGDIIVSDLKVRNGDGSGAGVHVVGGTVVLDGLVIEDNDAGGNLGGGIRAASASTVTVRDSRIRKNSAGRGGGIEVAKGDVTIENVTIADNYSRSDGGGIAVGVFGDASISETTITGNRAESDGGGIWNTGELTLVDTVVEAPITQVGQAPAAKRGGGIFNRGKLTVTGGRVGPNKAEFRGGGIFNDSPIPGDELSMALTEVSITGNEAISGDGGGLYLSRGTVVVRESTVGTNRAGELGGGLAMVGALRVSIQRATLSGNESGESGGGIANSGGELDLANATVSGNRSALGGGLALDGPTNLSHVTITANSAVVGGAAGGGGGALIAGGEVAVAASILAGNTSGAADSDCLALPGAGLVSDGFNVFGADVPGDCAFTEAASDVVGVDPRLGELGDNGGPVETHALLSTSPAVDLVPEPCSVPTDARNVVRPQGMGCDAGAYEFEGVGAVAPTVGLVDVSQGRWYLRNSAGDVTAFFYGNPVDLPIAGDWDGDGVATPGLYRQSDGFFYARDSNTQGPADNSCFAGDPADIPLSGDWDGDGDDNLGIYRPSQQRFYLFTKTCTGSPMGAAQITFGFGNPGDQPTAGDWDSDGVDEVGLYRESSGFFYWRETLNTGIADGQIFFGDPRDRFVSGDWGIVDGVDTPAVFRPGDLTLYFRHTLTQGNADAQFGFKPAQPGWLPVAGNFGLG